MTVSTDYAPKTYNGNGVTTVFPVTWPFDDDEDVTVTHTTAAGVQTTWVQDGEGATGYTLEETEPGSGDWEVTANTAPDIGTTLTLSRSTPLTQEFDLENGRTYNVNTMEGHLDRMVMQNQEAYHAASLQDAENVESAIAIENAENVEAATNVVSATTVQDATTVTTASEISGDIGTATTITQATGCTITNADTVNEFGGVTATAADLNKVPGIVSGTQALDGLDVNGNADISGTANIHDTLTLSKESGTGLSVTADIDVDGTINGDGLDIDGTVDFSGTTNIHDTLTLSKTTGTGLSVTAGAAVGSIEIGGTAHGTHTGDVTGGVALTIANASVSQAKLKTSTGSVSTSMAAPTGENLTLPGGSYGFYPQVRGNSSATAIDGRIIFGSTGSASATTNIWLGLTSGGTAYATQRYVTSSGEVYWYFIKRDKITKEVISRYAAPDHPCFGNGGDPSIVKHPFPDYDPDLHEIVVINPTDNELQQIISRKGNRDVLQVLIEDYDIEEIERQWSTKFVTVGLSDGADFYGSISNDFAHVESIKMAIPRPEGVLCRGIRLKPAKQENK